MNILYGVSGEGFGHASHALEIAKELKKRGHKILIFTYDRGYDVLKDKFSTYKVHGINLTYENGKINYTKSIFKNIHEFSKNIYQLKSFKKTIEEFKPDLCLSDMEPTVAMISHIYGLPLISLSNQNRFTKGKIDFPKKYLKDYLIGKLAIKLTVPGADRHIILSISEIKHVKKGSIAVNPIIRKEIRTSKPKYGKRVLVYLSKENNSLLEMLKKINQEFDIYGYNIERKESNLHFKKKNSFLKDFVDCKAIISTSGFTSISEAIYLKKPYLAVPLKGQFEQIHNALTINKMKIGLFKEKLDEKAVKEFLSSQISYRKNLAKYKPKLEDPIKILTTIIDEFQKEKIKS